jgi:phosphoglycolate phosphatase-like HAD superfamily hydrolase
MGMADYFDYVVCADDTSEHKPHPAPILKFLEISGNDRSEIVYIGDTKYDKECAEGAGVKFGLAVWGAKNADGIDPTYFLHRPDDIFDIL